jgi:hypothetical protein
MVFLLECYLLVEGAPVGTQAAMFDVDAALGKNVPTHRARRLSSTLITFSLLVPALLPD